MKRFRRILYIFFGISYALVIGLSLLPIEGRYAEIAFLFGEGIAIFAMIVSSALAIVLEPARDYRVFGRNLISLLLIIFGTFTASSWSAWGFMDSIWVVLAGLSLANYDRYRWNLIDLAFSIAALIVSFFPGLLWISMILISANGAINIFGSKRDEGRFIAFFVCGYATSCALSCVPSLPAVPLGLFVPFFVLALGLLGPSLVRLRIAHRRNLVLTQREQALARVEEKALREEIRPHFLLNALNNVRVAYQDSPEAGKELLDELIDLETSIASVSERPLIPIKEEINIIRGLIRLFCIERKTTLRLETRIENPELMIPPMLLEPLVENSLQHSGILSQQEGSVSIHQSMEFGFAIITVRDNGSGQSLPSQSRGIGLSNVTTRVSLLDEGHLSVNSNENGTEIEIRFRVHDED